MQYFDFFRSTESDPFIQALAVPTHKIGVSNLVENRGRGNSSWKLTRKTIYEQYHVMVKEYPFGTIAHLLTPFQANIVYSPAYSYWLGCLSIDSIFLFCGLISHWFFLSQRLLHIISFMNLYFSLQSMYFSIFDLLYVLFYYRSPHRGTRC